MAGSDHPLTLAEAIRDNADLQKWRLFCLLSADIAMLARDVRIGALVETPSYPPGPINKRWQEIQPLSESVENEGLNRLRMRGKPGHDESLLREQQVYRRRRNDADDALIEVGRLEETILSSFRKACQTGQYFLAGFHGTKEIRLEPPWFANPLLRLGGDFVELPGGALVDGITVWKPLPETAAAPDEVSCGPIHPPAHLISRPKASEQDIRIAVKVYLDDEKNAGRTPNIDRCWERVRRICPGASRDNQVRPTYKKLLGRSRRAPGRPKLLK